MPVPCRRQVGELANSSRLDGKTSVTDGVGRQIEPMVRTFRDEMSQYFVPINAAEVDST